MRRKNKEEEEKQEEEERRRGITLASGEKVKTKEQLLEGTTLA